MIRDFSFLDRRPVVVAIAGACGAGKTTFYYSYLADAGLRFVDGEMLAGELGLAAYEAADAAAAIRSAMLARRESFISEFAFSDAAGDDVTQLRSIADQGYHVVVIFIRIADRRTSIERTSMRASQGGPDVPDELLLSRFDRTSANLSRAIAQLPHIIIFDNSDLAHPYRHVATYHHGNLSVDFTTR